VFDGCEFHVWTLPTWFHLPRQGIVPWLVPSIILVLTGQDAFSRDQARGFAPTPQEFQFGVCASASSDPHCTVDPGSVPKAMDVVTPARVSQADLLDYTVHQPVVLQAVTIP
jgi:glucoamylase